MTVADHPLTGPEAAALYSERLATLRAEQEEKDSRARIVLNAIHDAGGELHLSDVSEKVDMPVKELVDTLNDLLRSRRITADEDTLRVL